MSKRQRGVVLTDRGHARLAVAIAAAQDEEKYGKRFTQAELAERTALSIRTFKKIRDRTAPVDETSVRAFFAAFDLALEAADYGHPERTAQASEPRSTQSDRNVAAKIDWGEKPDTAIFFGRAEELAALNQWVMAEQCRVVTLLGMGGIGKTSLAAKLADQIHSQFDYVIWRSLREAPPLDEILVRLIQFLSDQQETEINLPSRLGERIIRLLHYLRSHRCLLVLDNLESILQAESTGQFREGYEGYGELIHRIGEAEHQSCLLLTSRECPRELAPMAGDRLPVRLWSVTGIDPAAGREILQTKGLELDEANPQSQALIDRYSGNPQALHLVATAIQREFLGDVDDFLEEEGAAVEDVRTLLDQHLTRLAPLERSILFWLAINREPVGLDELMEDLLPPVTKREVRSALRGLSDRYLIETVGKQFTLQNVIMEFVSDRFVEKIGEEFKTQQFDLFHTHALIKATAKDYVRETQVRLILNPVVVSIDYLDKQVNLWLATIRQKICYHTGYAAGNLLNLLCQSQFEVCHFDFSGLTLRQIYLKRICLHALNLSNTVFVKPKLIYPFCRIWSVAFSPDGKWLAAGGDDAAIRLWDVKQWKCVHTFVGHSKSVTSIAFSPDGKCLVSGGHDATIRLWDVKQQKCVHTFNDLANWVNSVAFSPNGKWLATGGNDAAIRLWDVDQKRCIHTFLEHSKPILSVAFSPNGKWLLSGSNDTTLRLWDVEQRQCVHIVSSGLTNWMSVAFSPDGQLIVVGGGDASIRLWNIQQRKYVYTFIGHNAWVNSVKFNSDGNRLASGSGDRTVRLWDIQQGKCIHTFLDHTVGINSVAFSTDNKLLASGGGDATLRLWDIEQQKCIHTFFGHSKFVNSVAFSVDGKYLVAGNSDSTVRLWDIQLKKCVHTFTGHANWVNSVAFSPDGQWLATGSGDFTVRLWNIQQKKCVHTLASHTNWVNSIAFSPDGRWLATGGGDSIILLWDIQQRKCVHTFSGHTAGVLSIAFSFDGQWLATGSCDSTIRLWDVQHRKLIDTFISHTNGWVKSVAFSHDGKWLVMGNGDSTIQLWDIQQRQCVHTFNGHTYWVNSVAFSHDDKWLATSGGDATIRLWDAQQWKCSYTFTDHTAEVRSVVFSADSQKLATGSSDATIRLWDIESRACLAVLPSPGLYEGTNITGVKGLTDAQRASMIALGAVDHSSESWAAGEVGSSTLS